MRDPEDAIDEAYGSWLGSSGYANMKSYRDVFKDGWNAGSDHEARNCPQEGRIVALKAENERLRGALRAVGIGTLAQCPVCLAERTNGEPHDADCALVAGGFDPFDLMRPHPDGVSPPIGPDPSLLND